MLTQEKAQTAEEFVKSKYPTAFVYDDGQSIRVKVRATETRPCHCCGQDWTRDKHVDFMKTLGHAGNQTDAWSDARRNILDSELK